MSIPKHPQTLSCYILAFLTLHYINEKLQKTKSIKIDSATTYDQLSKTALFIWSSALPVIVVYAESRQPGSLFKISNGVNSFNSHRDLIFSIY